MVQGKRTPAALAADGRRLRNMAQRGHPAADTHRAGNGLLGTVHGAVALRRRPGRRNGRRGAEGMAGTGLLLPGEEPPCRRTAGGRDGGLSPHLQGTEDPEGRRRLYGRRHRLLRLRRTCRGGGRQCLPCPLPLLRHRYPDRLYTGEEGVPGHGAVAHSTRRTGRLQPGHHGLRSHTVYTGIPEVCHLPAVRDVHCFP